MVVRTFTVSVSIPDDVADTLDANQHLDLRGDIAEEMGYMIRQSFETSIAGKILKLKVEVK